jgi:hypothetical protein
MNLVFSVSFRVKESLSIEDNANEYAGMLSPFLFPTVLFNNFSEKVI